MQRYKRINHCFADAAPKSEISAYFGRLGTSHDDPSPSFHEVKGDSNDRGVFADQEGLWCERKDRMNCGKQTALAWHVMSPGSHRAEGRTPQDKLASVITNQVG